MISRPFGCEFEFSSDFDDVKKELLKIIGRKNLNAKDDDRDSTDNKKWELKTEGSTQAELATPVSNLRNIKKISRVIYELGRAGIVVSKNDGFHVHVHASDVDKRNLVATWLRMEPTIFKFVPKHRINNRYCFKLRPGRKEVHQYYLSAVDNSDDHWAALSFTAMNRIETVEIRIAEGTLDPVFVDAWIRFCVNFVNYSKTVDGYEMILKEKDMTASSLIDKLELPDSAAEYLLRRAHKFGR